MVFSVVCFELVNIDRMLDFVEEVGQKQRTWALGNRFPHGMGNLFSVMFEGSYTIEALIWFVNDFEDHGRSKENLKENLDFHLNIYLF